MRAYNQGDYRARGEVVMGHIHAELMMQYAEDARETDKPWERWQYLPCGQTAWEQCSIGPVWCSAWQYRRKPRTITINGREVPEPLRKVPLYGDTYHVVTFASWGAPYCFVWGDDERQSKWFALGLCHSTKEAAIAHAEALLSFTEAK